jgi:serine/arginine repetitive matrix protein 2
MAASLSATIHALVPSENWDDDFEFNPHDMNQHNDKQPNDHYPEFNPHTPPSTSRMSIVSSQYTQEDWDADSRQASPQQSTKVISSSKIPSESPTRRPHDTENWDDEFHTSPAAIRLAVGDRTSSTSITTSGKQRQYTPPPPTAVGVLTDKNNLKTPPPLEAWAEPGPSTPSSKRASINSNSSGCAAIRETENWDDDFDLDKPDSPARWSVKKGVKPRATKKAQLVESWDDEFSLTPLRGAPPKGPSARSRLSTSPSRSRINATGRAAHLEYSSSSESEDELPRPLYYPSPQHNLYSEQEQEEDDPGEFGHVPKHHDSDEEEDRTVTARTRHRLARQVTSLANSSPPPPMPSLPLFPRPFPRSPTPSVFSVPATAQTHSSYNSTTHLRPTISRSSSGAGGLAGLPPSPPIHKERERRRLRKKSRPHNVPNPQMYELTAVRTQPYAMPKSFSDGELVITEHEEDVHRPRTPSPPPPISIPSTPCGGGNGPTVGATPQSQIRAGALLSRIGSVKKKWSVGGRKRGGSVTPAEVAQGLCFFYHVRLFAPLSRCPLSIGLRFSHTFSSLFSLVWPLRIMKLMKICYLFFVQTSVKHHKTLEARAPTHPVPNPRSLPYRDTPQLHPHQNCGFFGVMGLVGGKRWRTALR